NSGSAAKYVAMKCTDAQQLSFLAWLRVCDYHTRQPCSAEFGDRRDLTAIVLRRRRHEESSAQAVNDICPMSYQIFHQGLEAWKPGRGAGVGRGLAVAVDLGATVGVGVGVTVDVAVGVGDGG